MKEIVNIHIGQCGTQIGEKFWEKISEEHLIDISTNFVGDANLEPNANVFFNKLDNKKFTSRAIFVDLDPNTLISFKSSKMGQIHKIDNIVAGRAGTGKNWAKGYYTEGAEHIENIIDIIRKEVEACDNLDIIQLTHSLCGGTGSGLGALLINKLKEEFTPDMANTFAILPSLKTSNNVLEAYNSVLSIHLLKQLDGSIIMNNEAISKVHKSLKNNSEKLTFENLNSLIVSVMSNITSANRFPSTLTMNSKKWIENLIPFPRLSFLVPSYSQVESLSLARSDKLVVQLADTTILDQNKTLFSAIPKNGRFFATAAFFRGPLSMHEIDFQMKKLIQKNSSYFTDWVPNSVLTSLCDSSQCDKHLSATFLSNSSSIAEVFTEYNKNFGLMFKRKAFVHLFKNEGMDEMEFVEAEGALNDICIDYTIHHNELNQSSTQDQTDS